MNSASLNCTFMSWKLHINLIPLPPSRAPFYTGYTWENGTQWQSSSYRAFWSVGFYNQMKHCDIHFVCSGPSKPHLCVVEAMLSFLLAFRAGISPKVTGQQKVQACGCNFKDKLNSFTGVFRLPGDHAQALTGHGVLQFVKFTPILVLGSMCLSVVSVKHPHCQLCGD